MAALLTLAFISLLTYPQAISALQAQVLSTFIFSRYGDRTPLYSDETSILTPYGAQQMYMSGSKFRSRYLSSTFDGSVTFIRDMSQYYYNEDEITILTTNDGYTINSAQAFMQGLYPGLVSQNNYTEIAGVSELANGTNIVAPLAGYQYPAINTASGYDLNLIWVDGAANCDAYTDKLIAYYNTSDFDFLYTSTLGFYEGLEPDFLKNNFQPNELGYFDAYYIYDYLQYEYLHNKTFAQNLSSTNMTRAAILASDWAYALFTNTSDSVSTIAGRTLATQIVESFDQAIESGYESNKMTIFFGDFVPMYSFAALAGLMTPQNAAFYNIPEMSSSFVFELVVLVDQNNVTVTSPPLSDLYVRFYYANGSDTGSTLVQYSLFGESPSQDLIPWSDFNAAMSRFSLADVKEWCTVCSSSSIFCPAFTGISTDGAVCPVHHHKYSRKILPIIGGIVGFFVAVILGCIVLGLLMVFAGVRFERQRRKGSGLVGFKGSDKMRSDQDLVIPKGGAEVTVASFENDKTHGHERVGSWELRDAIKKEEAGGAGAIVAPHRPSYEDDIQHLDPYTAPTKPHDHV